MIDIQVTIEQKEEMLSLMAAFSPINRGNYFDLDCPQCGGKREAFCYYSGGILAVVICNRKNECRFSKPIYKILEIKPKPSQKPERIAFNNHGIDMELMIESGVLTEDLRILLGRNKGKFYEQFLYFEEEVGKYRWRNPKGWTKKMGSFYPILHPTGDTVVIVGGPWDWMRGLLLSLAITSGIFGEESLPNDEDYNIFIPFKVVIIALDMDRAGVRGAAKLGRALSARFPQKEIYIVKYPKQDMDFCDYLSEYSINDFFSLDRIPAERRETASERSRRKFIEKMEKQNQQKKQYSEEKRRIEVNETLSFLVTDKGVFKVEKLENTFLKKSFHMISNICHDDVEIKSRLSNLVSDAAMIEITWGGRSVICPAGWLMSRNFENLANIGLRITGSESGDLAKYFNACLGEIPETKPYSTKNGWINEEEFILGKTSLRFKDERIIYSENEVKVQTGGDFKKWLVTVKEFVEGEPQNSIILGAAAISPALKIIFCPSYSQHTYGGSSSGKTLSQKVAASIIGKPSDIIQQWSGTPTGHELYFERMQNLAAFLDDAQEAEDKTLQKTCYALANGAGKTRGTIRKGQVSMADLKRWHLVMISSGEKTITEVSKFGGLSGRVIEMQRRPEKVLSPSDCFRIEATVQRNYGHAAKPIISYIIDNKDILPDRFVEILAEIQALGLASTTISERLLPFWSSIILGCEILRDTLQIDFDKERICDEIVESFKAMTNANPVESLHSTIKEIYNSNKIRFHIKCIGGKMRDSSETETWGVHYVDDEVVFFYSDILRREIGKRGFSSGMLKLLGDHLDRDSDNRLTKKITLNGMTCRMIGVKLKEN